MGFRVFLPGAESDIVDAADWIAGHSPIAAARWLQGIRAAIDTLSEMPLRCPVAAGDFGRDVNVRQLFYGRRRDRYRILFTMAAGTVYVLRVRHGARFRVRQSTRRVGR